MLVTMKGEFREYKYRTSADGQRTYVIASLICPGRRSDEIVNVIVQKEDGVKKGESVEFVADVSPGKFLNQMSVWAASLRDTAAKPKV